MTKKSNRKRFHLSTLCVIVVVLTSIMISWGEVHRETAKAQSDWKFEHIVVDDHPPATYRLNDIQIGDIDGDGKPDIWLSGRGAGEDVYQMVWYKNPDWTRYEIAPGDFKYGNLGDIDGDGDLDVVADNFWFENTGNPEERDWPVYPLALERDPDYILLGDLNNDGRLDVIANTKKQLIWMPGPEDPKDEWASVLLGEDDARTGGTLADIDGDGDLDIVWGNGWVENTGNPDETPWPMHLIYADWSAQTRGAVGDLDGDGKLDVILSGEESRDGVTWYSMPDDPKTDDEWEQHNIAREGYEGVHSLKVVDFDLDGDLDVFAGEMHHGEDPDQVTVFENVDAANNEWVAHVIDTGGTHNAKVGDINGDGYPDIVGKNYEAGELPLQVDLWINHLGKGEASVEESGEVTTETTEESEETSPAETLVVDSWRRYTIDKERPWRAVFVRGGDINGDSLPDIVAGGWWYQNPGSADGTWERHDIGGDLNNMALVYDFDEDGDLDILGTKGKTDSNEFVLAENDGQASFTYYDDIPKADGDFLQGVAVDQIIPGGGPEIVLSWHDETGTQMFSMPDSFDGEWTWSVISEDTTGEAVVIADVDGDGDLDIHMGTIWLRNDGDNTWTTIQAVTMDDPEADPDRVKLVDIDGDGDQDAVIGAEHADRLIWAEAPDNPEDTWTEHVISTDSAAMSMDVSDLDSDGDPDIVIGEHVSDGRIFIFQNENQGSDWTATEIDSGVEHHVGTQLIDIDNDGDLDIISTGWNNELIMLYENEAIENPGDR